MCTAAIFLYVGKPSATVNIELAVSSYDIDKSYQQFPRMKTHVITCFSFL